MFSTAATVARTSGKNEAIKIKNTVGKSPTPNHKIAKGIHASGDKLRKKLINGRNAVRVLAWCPSQRPTGTPVNTARANPVVTRNKDATTSSNRRPALNLSLIHISEPTRLL